MSEIYNSKHILLADDDQEFSSLLKEYLTSEGYSIDVAYNGRDATQKALETSYDLIILDVMMPVQNGFESLKLLRRNLPTPVIMLTAKGDDVDRILGLEMGADDYLAKPCNPRELSARIKAIFRRVSFAQQEAHVSQPMRVGDLVLYPRNRRVTGHDQEIPLTYTEFDILRLLLASSGNVVSKEEISERILERKLSRYDRSIDMHISNIRKKLESYVDNQHTIKTVRGIGFLFDIIQDGGSNGDV